MLKKIFKITFLFAIPWIVMMTIFNSLFRGGFTVELLISTTIGGIIAGLTFSIVLTYTAARLYKKTIVDINDEEKRIREGGANHLKGKEGVGGKLVLTDKRLIFKSHKFNIQNHQASFGLTEIQNANASKTLGLFNNVLTIDFANDEKHKFIIDEPGDWVRDILSQKILLQKIMNQ